MNVAVEIAVEKGDEMFDTNDPILSAAGITLQPGNIQPDLIEKILADSLVGQRVMELLIRRYAAEAIAPWHPLEKEALRRRMHVNDPVKTKPVVEWGLLSPDQTQAGRAIVKATCGPETINFTGTPAALKTFRFHGAPCPGDIIWLYETYCAPAPDPIFIRDERERQKYALEQKMKQNPSEIEAIVQEQINKDSGIPSSRIILD
jgi:hypothetical protein